MANFCDNIPNRGQGSCILPVMTKCGCLLWVQSRIHVFPLPLMNNYVESETTWLPFSDSVKRFEFPFKLQFIPNGTIDNKSALAQIMACHLTGAKPLSEPMMTNFIDTYMHHSAYNRKRLHLWNMEIQCTRFNYYIQFILNHFIMRLKSLFYITFIKCLCSPSNEIVKCKKVNNYGYLCRPIVWLQDPVHPLSSSTAHSMHPFGTWCNSLT